MGLPQRLQHYSKRSNVELPHDQERWAGEFVPVARCADLGNKLDKEIETFLLKHDTPLAHNESDDHSTDGTQDKDRCVGFGDDGVRQA
jgi:hypothetical protein